MDIEFYCFKCGQHIVIDATGAGQAVNCPKCGQPLTVPQTQPVPSKPTAPAYIPPAISKPIAQKRKVRTGFIVGISAALLLFFLIVALLNSDNNSSSVASSPKPTGMGCS